MRPVASDDIERLVEEQAALRRVATLVAGAPDPQAVLEMVTREASRVLDLPVLTLMRFEPDGTATVMAEASNSPFRAGANFALDGPSVMSRIAETGRPARIDSYEGLPGAVAARLRSAGARAGYGVPVLVDGKLWGAMAAVQTAEVPFGDAEERLANFTELIAIAISNAQARDDLRRLAAEQASLRRVATLVARGPTREGLFSVVAAEVQRLFDVPDVAIVRFEQREVVVVGAAGGNAFIPLGGRWRLDGPSVCASVLDSGRPARLDEYGGLSGGVADIAQKAGFESVAGAPIVVDDRVWGAIVVVSSSGPLPDRSEVRVAEYTELVAAAISNETTRTALIASRARIVSASDEARRRVERDLHDGIQQRLIALTLDVQTLRGQAFKEASPQSGAQATGGRPRTGDQRGARNFPRPASRPAGPARAAATAAGARAEIADPGRAARQRAAVARAGRGRDVLRRVRGAHQRDQALPCVGDHDRDREYGRRTSERPCRTTGSEGRSWGPAPD